MIPPLLQRCEANLLSKVSDKIPNVVYVRDEILGQFGELFATDGIGDNPDELDFFEIRFNRAFKLFRIDILRKEKKTQRVRAKSHAPLPDMYENESTSDEEFFVRLSEKFRTPATQESTIALKNLLEAIESLPTDERDAVVLCPLMGYEVESENPNKTTGATLCGVTGRTIRNRLSNAAKILSRFKEDLQ
jgi:DNA-directed RNA polymerase specialized sigma24 family protein